MDAELNEITAKALSLQTLLDDTEIENTAARTAAQTKIDELTAQAASLSGELEDVLAQFASSTTEKEAMIARLEARLAESEATRDKLQRKVFSMTAHAVYWNNTACTFGLHLRDLRPDLTDKWYTITPIDLSEDGTQRFELVGGNMWIIGHVSVTVEGDSMLIDREIILDGKGRTKLLSEYLNLFKDLDSITPEALEHDGLYGRGYQFGEPISIEKDLGGDTKVIMFVRDVASFNPRVTDDHFLARMWPNLPHRVAQRSAMLEIINASND